MSFRNYAELSFNAFVFSQKQEELTAKKSNILHDVWDYYGCDPASVLFVGFSPAILDCAHAKIFVTEVTEEVQKWLNDRVEYTYIPREELSAYRKQVDCVIAFEEFFTFAATDNEQRSIVDEICGLARQLVITTLRDYKNQDFKDKEFSVPSIIRNGSDHRIYFEFNNTDAQDRNVCHRTVYEISPDHAQIHAGFVCRNMYFKQLAKFSMDAGARDFLVHKNLMYKSLIKKNYEHVISIKFEQNGGHVKTT